MKIVVRLAAMMSVAFLLTAVAYGQSPQDARITVAHPGFDALKEDLKAVMDLTLPVEQQQWPNIEGFIDSFVMGLSGERPFYIVVPTGMKPASYLFAFPLSATEPIFSEFRDNLIGLGYEFRRDETDHGLYKLDDDESPDFGWLRVLPDTRSVLLILTTDREILPQLREIILKAVVPKLNVEGSMIAELVNDDPAPAAQQKRREAFAEIRRVSMERVKQRPEESATEFAVRTQTAKLLLDEGERLLAEANQVKMVLDLDKKDPAKLTASIRTNATAIPETTLDAAIAQVCTQPDAFASLAEFENSALSFRVNHPIDPMRQKNILELMSLIDKDMGERLKGSKKLSDPEKVASQNVKDGIFEIIRDGINSGYFTSFVEAIPDGKGDFLSVAAVSAPTASKLNDVLPMLTAAGKGNIVEMALDKVGDVTIHRIQLAVGYFDLSDKYFGKQKDLFIGVGPAHVWFASGIGAKDKLKATIAGLGPPAPNKVPLHARIHFLPWVQRLEDIAKTEPEATLPADKELQRENARQRARAIASFVESDSMTLDFTVENGEVVGGLKMETGLLRFVGKVMAAYSKANLE